MSNYFHTIGGIIVLTKIIFENSIGLRYKYPISYFECHIVINPSRNSMMFVFPLRYGYTNCFRLLLYRMEKKNTTKYKYKAKKLFDFHVEHAHVYFTSPKRWHVTYCVVVIVRYCYCCTARVFI